MRSETTCPVSHSHVGGGVSGDATGLHSKTSGDLDLSLCRVTRTWEPAVQKAVLQGAYKGASSRDPAQTRVWNLSSVPTTTPTGCVSHSGTQRTPEYCAFHLEEDG